MNGYLKKWAGVFKEYRTEILQNTKLLYVMCGSAITVTNDDEVFGIGKGAKGYLGQVDIYDNNPEPRKIKALCKKKNKILSPV